MTTINTQTNMAKPRWLPQALSDLDRHEGFRQYAYPDPLSKLAKTYPATKHGWGKRPARVIAAELGLTDSDLRLGAPWTVGHGFTYRVTPDTSISKEMSMRRLEQEALDHAAGLDKVLPDWRKNMPLYAQTVVVNMIYNLGKAGFASFNTTINLLKQGKYAEAGTNLRKSLWFKQVKGRAEELVTRLEKGEIAPEHRV